eukprot:gene5188-18411_t
MSAVTSKRLLFQTLEKAYGSDKAASIIKEWRLWLAEHKDDPESQTWILKTAQHLGKGIKIAPRRRALKEVLNHHQKVLEDREEGKKKSEQEKPFVIAQQYVNKPLLVDGRKFGIRVWAVVIDHDPIRVYLHQNGLVLFSGDSYDEKRADDGLGNPGQGHITNYALNMNGTVWTLQQLRDHIGHDCYNAMYSKLQQNVALTYAATLPSLRAEAEKMRTPPNSTFELMGLDFMVDDQYRPWLLEVNSTPSLAVEHQDPEVLNMIYTQKNDMVVDMVKLLCVSDRFSKDDAIGGEELAGEEW